MNNFSKPDHALVIGSSGFLGSAVVSELARSGWRITAVRNRRQPDCPPDVTVIPGGMTVLSAGLIRDLQPDLIIHCARPVMPALRRWGRRIAAWQAAHNNRTLVRSLAGSGTGARLVFASGSLLYGNSQDPHTEQSPLRPISYAREYHSGETPLLRAPGEADIRLVRFPWILGQGSWFDRFYLRFIRESGRVPVFGKGTNRMALVGLNDAARLMIRAGTYPRGIRVLNAATPHVLTQEAFAGRVAERFGGTVEDFRRLFPSEPERATLEAFTSNIVLATDHPGFFEGFRFASPDEVMSQIRLQP